MRKKHDGKMPELGSKQLSLDEIIFFKSVFYELY